MELLAMRFLFTTVCFCAIMFNLLDTLPLKKGAVKVKKNVEVPNNKTLKEVTGRNNSGVIELTGNANNTKNDTKKEKKDKPEDHSAFDTAYKVNNQFDNGRLYTQGDLWLGKQMKKDKNNSSRSKRHRRYVENTKLWYPTYDNDTNKIPFRIDLNIGNNVDTHILDAIELIEDETCIKFEETFAALDYLFTYDDMIMFEDDQGCWSDSVGMYGGTQHISLSDGCSSTSVVLHEILHALGFWHTQSRTDRDSYVTVNYSNIITEYNDEFQIHNETLLVGNYDLESIMHYGPLAYSSNGQETIEPTDPNESLYENTTLSPEDIAQLNELYCV